MMLIQIQERKMCTIDTAMKQGNNKSSNTLHRKLQQQIIHDCHRKIATAIM